MLKFSSILHTVLDVLFPHTQAIAALERMTHVEFIERAGKAEERAGKGIISIAEYRRPLVRQAVWELKYRGNKKVAGLLGAALYEEMLAFLEEYAPLTGFTSPLLIPIPLSKRRERERGFNQSLLLAEAILKLDGGQNFALSTALSKVKDTQSQTKTESKGERIRNLIGCFKADASVKGRNIILIDDVATTGATLEEASKTLRRAGARKIIAFTVAH